MTQLRSFLIEPFDIMLHATEEGVQTLQARFCHLAAHPARSGAFSVLADARQPGREDRPGQPRRP